MSHAALCSRPPQPRTPPGPHPELCSQQHLPLTVAECKPAVQAEPVSHKELGEGQGQRAQRASPFPPNLRSNRTVIKREESSLAVQWLGLDAFTAGAQVRSQRKPCSMANKGREVI